MKDLQNTPEWFEDRLGYITCSQLYRLKTPATRQKYILQLADERQGITTENFSTYHTKRGHGLEAIAIKVYEGINDVKTIKTGFIKSQDIFSTAALFECVSSLPPQTSEQLPRALDSPPEPHP